MNEQDPTKLKIESTKDRIIYMIRFLGEVFYSHSKEFWEDEEKVSELLCRSDLSTKEMEFINNLVRTKTNMEKIALIHSELSEYVEASRKDPILQDEHCPDFLNIEIELADVFIRLVEFAHKRNYRLGEAIVAKHNFNTTRQPKHGKTF